MKVLVTGGAGYLGGAVTDELLLKGFQTRVYDKLLYEDSYRKEVEFVNGDVRDEKKLRKSLSWADAVIWLAALVGDGACAIKPEVSREINQDAVKFLSENFDGRIVFPSTCSVYGAQAGLLDEAAQIKPLSVYAATKASAEMFLQGKNSIIFRLGTLYGVSDLFSRIRLDLVVNTLTMRAFLSNKIMVFGGEQYRPVLHVRDTAEMMVRAVERGETGTFNLHRQNICIMDLAHQIRNHFEGMKIVRENREFEDTRNYRADSGKSMSILGFNPKRTIDLGIDEVKALFSEGRVKPAEAGMERYNNCEWLKRMGVE